MTPSEQCKAAGLTKGVAELSRLIHVSRRTLNNWYKYNPDRFNAALENAALMKKSKEE